MSFLSKIIIYGFLLIGFCQFTGAQTTKQIEVDGNEPYVDHVSLMEGSTDMDLLVKFMFDEPNNSLTVSLISYRKLFVHATRKLSGVSSCALTNSPTSWNQTSRPGIN